MRRSPCGTSSSSATASIAHLAGPLDWLDALGRVRGWERELRQVGLEPQDVVIGDWTVDCVYELARRPGRLPPCTVMLPVGNDEMALGLVHGFSERGISVPRT